MKKTLLLCISLLALAIVLITLAPTTTLAKRKNHFTAVLTPTAISATVLGTDWPVRSTAETNVWPIVEPVEEAPTIIGWIVDSRSFYGDVSGDIDGEFTLAYGGIFDTLQSGSMHGIAAIQTNGGDVIYFTVHGVVESEIIDFYPFAEIKAWCEQPETPSLGVFFAQIYNVDELEELSDEELGAIYGDALSLLPMTLSAEFTGAIRVDAGIGIYSSIFGEGKFGPAGKQPLILHVYPNQHVYELEGALEITIKYDKKEMRKLLNIDKDKLPEVKK